MSPSRSMFRRAGAAVLAVAATIGAGALAAAPSQASTPGVYSVPYSPTLYAHSHTAQGAVTTPLGFDQWRARGFPRPTPVTTDFVRYPWSPHVYAVSYFDDWLWTKLTPAQWARAGHPAPRVAGHIEGTVYFSFLGGPEIIAGLDGVAHVLAYEEWARSGFRQPAGTDLEFFKLTWTAEIAAYKVVRVHDELVVETTVLTPAEWAAAGSPDPWVMPMLPGDEVCTVPASADLYYDGASVQRALTFEEWRAAGFPAPTCVLTPEAG